MRPPPESGGYFSPLFQLSGHYCSFNEAAARKRRIPAMAGFFLIRKSRFNEAAARKRRIPPYYENYNRYNPASMRPPPESGGYMLAGHGCYLPPPASMRPPPESGGYQRYGRVMRMAEGSFNEAAARKRRIPPATNTTCPLHSWLQ